MSRRWEPGPFGITGNGGLHMVWGSGWRAWGVHRRRNGRYVVTHLPTGMKLPFALPTLATARRFAERVDPLTDWDSVSAQNAAQRLEEIGVSAIFAAYTGALRTAGYRVKPVLDVIDGSKT